MKVTVSKAAILAGISRQQLYRGYISPGKISVIKDGNKSFIDIAELVRVFPDIKVDGDGELHEETVKIDSVTHENSEIVTLLKSQLAEAKEREKWLTDQIDELRYQQSHLLEDKTAGQKQERKKIFGIF